MAKKKSHKKFASSKENPFNIKVNRSKHSVLGQKVKGTRGLPGVSHSVGNAKRKEEFHKKKILSRKANKFVDKRLLDNTLSYEEQATHRLVEERKRKLKKNIFNLNDDESLTHKGVPLDHQKSLNDRLNDSDDDEQLDAKFVRQAHFGGFTEDSATEQRSRKEIIEDLIADSKKRKMEKKMEREKNEDLIEKLDQKWKETHHSLPIMKGKKQNIITATEKKDPFDIMLQELKYEIRATPAGRVKTAEEIANEENEKIKQLEEQRLKRMMNPMDDIETKNNLLSADSIYDGLDIQLEPIDDQEPENINMNSNENSEDDESNDDSSDDSENENEVDDNVIEENDDKSISVCIEDDFNIPVNLEQLRSIVDNDKEDFYIIVEDILKDKIKSKSKKKIEKLEMFFGVLLEYILQSDDNISKNLDILDDILPSLYSLAEISPVNTAAKILTFLDKEQDLFQKSKSKKLKNNFPRFQCLVLFKIISSIYSVSDFKHPVVTPAIIFMCNVLNSLFIINYQNTIARLFISKIIYDCVSLSKRYVPEIVCFFNKTLELAINNSKKFNLFIDEAVTNEIRLDINFENTDKSCNALKASIIFEVIELLSKFAVLYEQLPCFKEIFSGCLNVLKRLPTHNYPNFLKEAVLKFMAAVESVKKTYKPLKFESKKPVPLKMFEPAFDSKFTRKKDDIQKKRKLIKNVNQKIRKEEKCLLREARRDNQVIASEKLKEKIEADEERKRKVKQLYSELAVQEGEYKKFIKKK